jgi:hypothetical protein
MRYVRILGLAPAAMLGAALDAAAQATAPAATPSSSGGGGGVIVAVVLIAALLVIIGAAVKVYDLKRKREADAVHVQAQVSDALLRESALFAVPVTATAHVPMWSGTPAAIVISGQVPSRELHDAVLRIVRQEATRIRPDVVITDRMVVNPSIAVRAA